MTDRLLLLSASGHRINVVPLQSCSACARCKRNDGGLISAPKEIYPYVCASVRSPVFGLLESSLYTDRSDCRGFLAK